MSRFQYRERSKETVQQRASQSGGDYDSYLVSGTPIYKVKNGQNAIRIMPPSWDPDDTFGGKKGAEKLGDNWGLQLWVHNGVGSDNANYLCPNKMLGEDCPICQGLDDLDEEAAKEIKAKKRILVYIIDRDNEKTGPQVWPMPWTVEKNFSKLSMERKTGAIIPIDHPDDGYDVFFDKEGAKRNTKYDGEQVDRNPSSLSDNDNRYDSWLDYIQEHPLPDLLQFYPAEHMQAVFMGKAKAADDTESEPPRRRRSAEPESDEPPPRKRRGEPEPEADEPPPRRGRSREPEPDEDELPNDAEMAENTARARQARDRGGDPDEAAPRTRRGRSAEPDDEPPPRSRRGREPEPDDEPPPRRRASNGEDKPRGRREPEPDEGDEISEGAKESLRGLKERTTGGGSISRRR